jgi:hypothetical protein
MVARTSACTSETALADCAGDRYLGGQLFDPPVCGCPLRRVGEPVEQSGGSGEHQ